MNRGQFLATLGLTGCAIHEEPKEMSREMFNALMGCGGLGTLVDDNYAELGLAYLQANAKFFYDFTELTPANNAAISNGDAGLNDIGPNNLDATIVGTPIVRDIALRYGTTIKTLNDNSTNAVSIGNNGATLFNDATGFKLWFVLDTLDGDFTPTMNIMGGIIPTNLGLNIFISATGANQGKVTFSYGNASGVVQKRTDNSIWNNGRNGLTFLMIEANWVANTIEFYLNGSNIPSTVTSGTIASINPSSTWSNTSNIYIGALNNNGTTTSNANSSSVVACACTPILTSQESIYVQSYLLKKCFKWQDEIHIDNVSDVSTLRASAINFVMNGGSTLDALTPTVTNGYTGVMHICNSSNITGFSSIDRLVYAKNDRQGFTWTNRAYLLHTSSGSPKNKLVINIQGHISDSSSAHETWMSELLAAGYDVLFCALCIASNDNTETNPNITLQSTSGHDQILTSGLAISGYSGLDLYLFDKCSSITYLESSYDEIYCCGISGGGWGTTLLMALHTSITRGVCDRGTMPASFKDGGVVNSEPDYEQGGTMFLSGRSGNDCFAFYTAHSYMDLYLMNSASGRRFKLLNHVVDTCCFEGTSFECWANTIINKAYQLGGVFEQATDTDVSRATHAYSTWDRSEMLDFFNAV